jgi:VWFA-related protein
MFRLLIAFCAIALGGGSLPGRAQEKPAPSDEKPLRAQEPFRTGAHYVRVDAYPTRDGRPIAGLTAADFELLEDGKLQQIDRVEFIDHPAWTPLGERRDPNSQRDGFELARDPKYRVFVLYLDAYHVDFADSVRTKEPIAELLNRMMGPQDLFGVLTPAQTPDDLLLGQLTQSIEEQLRTMPYWGIEGRLHPTREEAELEFVFPRDGKRLVELKRLDKVYSDLELLVLKLGELRDERKNIIFFSNSLVSPPSQFRDMAMDRETDGRPPGIGVDDKGKLTTGSLNAADPDRQRMNAERQRLLAIDFDQRFRAILQVARQANVAFYTVRPGGLDMRSSLMNNGTSNLRVLADETDGIAVLAANDLRGGMTKIADDLSSHYVLGFYTNNTQWDGRPRKLTVRLKAGGQVVRARREYRAPTEAEMAAIRDARSPGAVAPAAAPEKTALSALARISPSARVQAYGTVVGSDLVVIAEIAPAEIEAGRWRQGAEVQVLLTAKDAPANTTNARIEPGARAALVRVPVGSQPGPWQAVVRVKGQDAVGSDSDTVSIDRAGGPLLGRPIPYRAASAAASAYRPLAAFQFRRTERVRLEWPTRAALDSHQGRLLDRNGKLLAVPVTTTLRPGDPATLVTDVSLAPLSIGEYVIEIVAKAGDKTDTQMMAIRVSMAR